VRLDLAELRRILQRGGDIAGGNRPRDDVDHAQTKGLGRRLGMPAIGDRDRGDGLRLGRRGANHALRVAAEHEIDDHDAGRVLGKLGERRRRLIDGRHAVARAANGAGDGQAVAVVTDDEQDSRGIPLGLGA